MSATSCRGIFERRKRTNKSQSSTTQESHHSGSTVTPKDPQPSLASKMEPERQERVKEAKKNDILVIDDEIEESIKKEVLTLPQCVEMKVRDIRLKGDQAEKRNIVIFQNAQKPVEKVEGQKRPRAVKKAETKTTDIRKYLNNEKPIKINTIY